MSGRGGEETTVSVWAPSVPKFLVSVPNVGRVISGTALFRVLCGNG